MEVAGLPPRPAAGQDPNSSPTVSTHGSVPCNAVQGSRHFGKNLLHALQINVCSHLQSCTIRAASLGRQSHHQSSTDWTLAWTNGLFAVVVVPCAGWDFVLAQRDAQRPQQHGAGGLAFGILCCAVCRGLQARDHLQGPPVSTGKA